MRSVTSVLVSALSALLASSPIQQTQTLEVGTRQVIATAEPGRALYEPSLAVDPKAPGHWVAVAIHTARGATFKERTAAQTCQVVSTFDDGKTFTAHDFEPIECFDPWVVFTPAGTVVVSVLAKRQAALPDELLIFRSGDGGRTWPDPPASLGRNHDHSVMVVDFTGGRTNGWIYVTSHRPTRNENGERRWGPYVARSRDDGKTFDDPVTVVPNNLHNLSEMPVVLSDGSLVVSYVDAGYPTGDRKEETFDRRRSWTALSTDAGHAFSIPKFVNDACGPPPGYRLSALTADPTNDRLYFACRQRGGGAIVVGASADRGETWTTPVAPTATAPAAQERIPAISTNRGGVLLVAWIDGWGGPGRACEQSVSAGASQDGGLTFFGVQQISTVRPCADGTFVASTTGGDYFGVAPLPDNGFRILWSETPAGQSRLMTATVHVR
ncbi:MAG TPA: sialidase family protein [Vicinamibacterales bacterium]|jgi:hypothetical protein|nr:sialidase family protein [Vicinamibacterales bacterium]